MKKHINQRAANQDSKDIFDRMKAGEVFRADDADYFKVQEVVDQTLRAIPVLNASTDVNQIRERLAEIIGQLIDKSTTVFAPFHTNFGRFITLGKGIFINHACSFLDMGGITIEDDVLI